LIEPVVFTCQFCSERQEWDTREAADAAAVWHLFEFHPLRWRATAGDRCPTDLPPTRLGHRLTRIGIPVNGSGKARPVSDHDRAEVPSRASIVTAG